MNGYLVLMNMHEGQVPARLCESKDAAFALAKTLQTVPEIYKARWLYRDQGGLDQQYHNIVVEIRDGLPIDLWLFSREEHEGPFCLEGTASPGLAAAPSGPAARKGGPARREPSGMCLCLNMERVLKAVARAYHADPDAADGRLRLSVGDGLDLYVHFAAARGRVTVAHFLKSPIPNHLPSIAALLNMAQVPYMGWIAYEMDALAFGLRQAGRLDDNLGLHVSNRDLQEELARFADCWAERIEATFLLGGDAWEVPYFMGRGPLHPELRRVESA